MRSPAEIRFRLRQELGNLAMLAVPPTLPGRPPVSLFTPPIDAMRDSSYAAGVVSVADQLMAHRFPLLGLTIETGPAIDWRRDYLHGITTAPEYFRRVPYLDFARAGDHKVVWELNRHQHLVTLAQAWRFTGRREYLNEVFRQLASWLDANPFLRGINWASALEVAFRALSWAWVWTLAGAEMPPPLAHRFLTDLYRHGRFLELNLSVYFSPNTHLVGEAVALHALGVMFQQERWQRAGSQWTLDSMRRQVRADGSHFEQSAYYHVYALDFFLLHRALAKSGPEYDASLVKMAEYLDALLGVSGVLPLLGDDDGGRLFHPYGDRLRFGRATLATCASLFDRPEWLRDAGDLYEQGSWWLGVTHAGVPAAAVRSSRFFADAGTAVMAHGDVKVVIKAGGFGEGSGGHSHSDILSVTASCGDHEILIDPGTFTYIADPAQRNAFRGSAAHNTLSIGGRDQATPAGPFRWLNKPAVKVQEWSSTPERDVLDASVLQHRRRITFEKAESKLVIEDRVEGEEPVEIHWHLGSAEDARRIRSSVPLIEVEGFRSRALCSKEPAPVLRGKTSERRIETEIDLSRRYSV